jgi:hypothetical protein
VGERGGGRESGVETYAYSLVRKVAWGLDSVFGGWWSGFDLEGLGGSLCSSELALLELECWEETSWG